MIYVFWAKGTHFVKIGFTEDRTPNSRLQDLQIGCPYPLEVIAFAEGPRHLEHRIHWELREWSVRGEWFKWGPEPHRVVQILKARPKKTDWFRKPRRNAHKRLGAALSVEYRKSTSDDPNSVTGAP